MTDNDITFIFKDYLGAFATPSLAEQNTTSAF